MCCEACQRWVHFSCDTNQTHGALLAACCCACRGSGGPKCMLHWGPHLEQSSALLAPPPHPRMRAACLPHPPGPQAPSRTFRAAAAGCTTALAALRCSGSSRRRRRQRRRSSRRSRRRRTRSCCSCCSSSRRRRRRSRSSRQRATGRSRCRSEHRSAPHRVRRLSLLLALVRPASAGGPRCSECPQASQCHP